MQRQKRNRERGKLAALIVAVVLSSIIWLAFNLSQQYTEVVGVQVCASSDLEGRAKKSSSTSQVLARVKARGFYFLADRFARKDEVKTIEIRSADLTNLEGTDIYEISESQLRRYFNEMFGNDASLESFQSGPAQFKFLTENHKKVPIKAVQMITFKPQYCDVGGIRFSSDSVTIYGSPSRLDGIDAILTGQITANDVKSSIHGTATLEAPSGVRLSMNKVGYSLDVVRYVETSRKVMLKVRNAPRGTRLSIYPSSADVTFRCTFPYNNKSVEKMEFYIDYNEFLKSLSGRCVIRTDKLPDDILSYTVDPEVCECLVTENGISE